MNEAEPEPVALEKVNVPVTVAACALPMELGSSPAVRSTVASTAATVMSTDSPCGTDLQVENESKLAVTACMADVGISVYRAGVVATARIGTTPRAAIERN